MHSRRQFSADPGVDRATLSKRREEVGVGALTLGRFGSVVPEYSAELCLDTGMANKPDPVLVKALSNVPLFGECSAKEIQAVAQEGRVMNKRAGSVIVSEATRGVAFFLILDGTVEISRGGQSLARLMAGDFFGEMSLLVEAPRNADATATTDVQLFTFTPWTFKSMLLDNAKIAYGVARSIAARASAG